MAAGRKAEAGKVSKGASVTGQGLLQFANSLPQFQIDC